MAVSLTACVRTSDGSLEPRYVPEVRQLGAVPIVALTPNRRDPREQFPYRPASSPPPRMLVATDHAPPPRRRSPEVRPRQSNDLLSCRQVPTGGARVRWECR